MRCCRSTTALTGKPGVPPYTPLPSDGGFNLPVPHPRIAPSLARGPTKAAETDVWVQFVGTDADGNDTYILTSTSEQCVTLSHDQVGEAVSATRILQGGELNSNDHVTNYNPKTIDSAWDTTGPSEDAYCPDDYADDPGIGSYPKHADLTISSDFFSKFGSQHTWDGSCCCCPSNEGFSQSRSKSKASGRDLVKPNDAPGPAAYAAVQPDATSRMRSAPAFSFGKARRAPKPKEDDFSFVAGRDQDAIASDGDAGNAALKHGRFPKAPAYTMGKRIEVDSDPTAGPGPGKYVAELPRSEKGVKFSKSTRGDVDAAAEDLPGPADYYAEPTKPKGPAVTFTKAKAAEWLAGRDGPGPGKYHGDEAHKPRGPAAIVVSRDAGGGEPTTAGPGPGKYRGELDQSKGPTVAFTRDVRMRTDADVVGPGPGKYHGEVVSKKGPSATITAKPKDKSLGGDGPGPGLYAPTETRTLKGGVMGGTYLRPKLEEAGPGPMAYNDTAIRKTVPAASMAFRNPNRDDPVEMAVKRGGTNLIGITHDQHPAGKGPAITMGTKHDYAGAKKQQQAQLMPGPGSYMSSYTTGKRTSAATIVGRPKSPWRDRDMPGPADAVVLPPKSSKGAVIVGRYKSKEAKHEIGPGPGAYNVDLTAKGDKAKSTKGATMRFRPPPGPANDPHPDPGPGDYNPPAQRRVTQTLVMKPPPDPAHATRRRTQGSINLKQLNARSEQERRRQATLRMEQKRQSRASIAAADAPPN